MASNPPGAGKTVVSFAYDERRAAYLTKRGEALDQSRGYIVSAIVDWWFEHRCNEPLRKEVAGNFPLWSEARPHRNDGANDGTPRNRHNI